MSAAPDGTVIRRDTPSGDLLAFEVKDRITRPDIEWMASISDEAMTTFDTIDMLIIMSNYEGADLNATFDGYAMSVQTRSLAHVRRYCVVGAPLFAKAMIGLSGAVTPVETKTFELEEEAAAWQWICR